MCGVLESISDIYCFRCSGDSSDEDCLSDVWDGEKQSELEFVGGHFQGVAENRQKGQAMEEGLHFPLVETQSPSLKQEITEDFEVLSQDEVE